MGWVVNATPRPLYSRKRPDTHCIGGWMGPRAGLEGCGKSRTHRDSIPAPSSPKRVAIPTELSQPSFLNNIACNVFVECEVLHFLDVSGHWIYPWHVISRATWVIYTLKRGVYIFRLGVVAETFPPPFCRTPVVYGQNLCGNNLKLLTSYSTVLYCLVRYLNLDSGAHKGGT